MDITIQNFRFGLDSRREQLTSQPGTLVTCENAHINPGGEIEKRGSFTHTYPSIANSFGLEVTDQGLMVFGSAVDPGDHVGITYQRLQHPNTLDGGADVPMIAVVFSRNFNGKAFVAAKFNDNRVFLFYDGQLVQQSRNGLVLDGDLAKIGLNLQRQIRTIENWDAVANKDENGVTVNGEDIIVSPDDVSFTVVTDKSSALGQIGTANVAVNGEAVPGTKAFAKFDLNGGFTGTISATAPDENGTQMAISQVVTGATSAVNTAKLFAESVNALTYITGYTASYSGTLVTVFAPDGWFVATTPNLTVSTTGDITTQVPGGGVVAFNLSATVTPNPAVKHTYSSIGATLGIYVTANVSGGVPTYHYSWQEMSSGSGNGITIDNGAGVSCRFYKYVLPGQKFTGNFKLTVTDSGGSTPLVIPNIQVTLWNSLI